MLEELEREQTRRWPRSEGVARASGQRRRPGRGPLPQPPWAVPRLFPCCRVSCSALSPRRSPVGRRSTAGSRPEHLADDAFAERRAVPRRAFRGGPQAACWTGRARARGRRLVKPEESAQAADDARAAAVDPRHLAAERPAGGRFRRAGGPLQAHALRLEEEVRRVRARPG